MARFLEDSAPEEQQLIQQEQTRQPARQEQPKANQEAQAPSNNVDQAIDAFVNIPAIKALKAATELQRGSESIRARGLEASMDEGLTSPLAGPAGLTVDLIRDKNKAANFIKDIGKDSVAALVRALSPGKDKEFGLPEPREFGDIAREKGLDEGQAAIAGLAAELLTDPLFIGVLGEVPKGVKGVTKAVQDILDPAKRANARIAKTLDIPVSEAEKVSKQVSSTQPTLTELTSGGEDITTQLSKIKPDKNPADYELLVGKLQSELLDLKANQDLNMSDKISRANKIESKINKIKQEQVFDEAMKEFGDVKNRRPNAFTSLASTYVEERGPFGAMLSKLLNRSSLDSDRWAAKYITRISETGKLDDTFRQLSKEDRFNFLKAVEGFDDPNDVTRPLVDIYQSTWDEIGRESAKRNLSVELPNGEKIPFVTLQEGNRKLPHILVDADDVVKQPKKLKDMLDYNVEIGRFPTRKAAEEMFNSYREVVSGTVELSPGKVLNAPINAKTEKFYKWVQEKNRLSSIEEAREKLGKLLSTRRDASASNLEYARTIEIPFYETDPAVILERYYGQVGRRLADVDAFGKNNELANTLIEKIAETVSPKDAAFIRENILDVATGLKKIKVSDEVQTVTDVIRNIEVSSKLGRAVIMNSSQSKNTAAIAGFRNTAEAMAESFTKEGRQFAIQSGAIFDDFTSAIYGVSNSGITGKIATAVLEKTGFQTVEQWNRIVASIAGKNFAKDMGKRLIASSPGTKQYNQAVKALRKMDIDPPKVLSNKGVIDEEDLFRAARNMATKTQFRSRVIDQPVWAQHPVGKVANQFKNFIENETKFIRKELLREAKDGNIAPLVRYVSVAIPAGAGAKVIKDGLDDLIADFIGVDKKPKFSESNPLHKRLLEYAANVGAFGIYADILNSFLYRGPNWPLALSAGLNDIGALGAAVFQAGKPAFDKDNEQFLNLRPLVQFSAGLTPVVGATARRGFETEAVTKRRFSRAVREALENNIDPDPILSRAVEAGFKRSDILRGARTSIKSKKSKAKNLLKEIEKSEREGNSIRAALLRLGLEEA